MTNQFVERRGGGGDVRSKPADYQAASPVRRRWEAVAAWGQR